MSWEVLTLLRTDVRHTGDTSKILIKYTSGMFYQCFGLTTESTIIRSTA